MKGTYIIADHVLSPLANGTGANTAAILGGGTGVRFSERRRFQGQGVCASLFSADQWAQMRAAFPGNWSEFELLLLSSVTEALKLAPIDLADPRTLVVVATTKGNIGLLEPGGQGLPARESAGNGTWGEGPAQISSLSGSATRVARFLGYARQPVVVSNACISGMTALLVAQRMMEAGMYDRALVTGADCIPPFVIAGFRSFQALSDEICRPFDLHRKGINLGEGAATMILSRERPGNDAPVAILRSGATTNDANHISGPSRTGEEMAMAIRQALDRAALEPGEIGFISAHGTATPFNDEMESRAFTHAGLQEVPAFSLKAYFGHTLGAAGLLESAIGLEALRTGVIPASKGYGEHGVSMPVSIARENLYKPGMRHFLKTGSGFGGCNAALLFSINQ